MKNVPTNLVSGIGINSGANLSLGFEDAVKAGQNVYFQKGLCTKDPSHFLNLIVMKKGKFAHKQCAQCHNKATKLRRSKLMSELDDSDIQQAAARRKIEEMNDIKFLGDGYDL